MVVRDTHRHLLSASLPLLLKHRSVAESPTSAVRPGDKRISMSCVSTRAVCGESWVELEGERGNSCTQ